jgi:hypothetical protein
MLVLRTWSMRAFEPYENLLHHLFALFCLALYNQRFTLGARF